MASARRHKRTGAWEVRAYAGKDPVTGRVRNLSRTLPPDTPEAEVGDAKAELDRQAAFCRGSGASWTVGGILAYDLSLLPSLGYSPTTVDAYASHLRCYVDPLVGGVRIDDAQPYMFASLYKALREDGGKDGNPLAANTVRQVHAHLSGSFGRLAETHVIGFNPIAGVTPPRQERVEAVPLSEPDFSTLQSRADAGGGIDEEIAALDLATGFRRGEVSGFQERDWSFRRSDMSVERVVVQSASAGSPWVYKSPKSKAGIRRVSLDAETNDRLADWYERSRADLRADGFRRTASTPLFAREDGSPYLPSMVYAGFSAMAREVGLDPAAHFHTLRHTHATYLLDQGVSIRVLQERLGHSSVNVTLQIYGHVLPGRDEAAAEAYGELRGAARRWPGAAS